MNLQKILFNFWKIYYFLNNESIFIFVGNFFLESQSIQPGSEISDFNFVIRFLVYNVSFNIRILSHKLGFYTVCFAF